MKHLKETRADASAERQIDRGVSRRRLVALGIGACAVAVVTACGKKADLKAPEGTVDKYPRKYPN